MKNLISIFFFVCISQLFYAQEIIDLRNGDALVNPGKRMYIYEDQSTLLSIKEITKPETLKLFTPATQEIPNFNVCASAIWSRFIITTRVKENWLLEVGNPNAESVKCFISKKNKLIDSVEFGIHSSNSGRALKTYHGYYDLNISPNDTLELFIRWTDKTPLHLQFSIGTVSKFFESDHLTNFSHGLFYGIIILMIIYNLFLAISGNGREYYFYVFYIFFNLLFLLFFTGHVSVLPQSIRNILYIHPVVIPAIFGTFGILFTMEFLQTKKLMPTIHFFMKLIIGFAAVIVLISLLNYFYIALFLLQIEGILLAAVCLGSGIISFRNKNKFAKFYLFGYGAYLLGLTFFIGSDYDFFPFFNQRIYILESGAIAEAVMLSFAIGEKLNSANRERSEAQQTALEISMENEKIIREQNSMLEQKVLERTQQLQTKNKIIEEKNRDILDSIRYAERIQKSFMATRELLDENLKDYFVMFQPKDVVSGDFYWSAKLPDGRFLLATADSTGHGVPGAIMSLLNITSLEKAIETFTEPSKILNSTRKIIIERLKKDGSPDGGKDGMDCSLISLNLETLKLQVAAALNPVWIIRKTTHPKGSISDKMTETPDPIVIEIKPDKMPVGKHEMQHLPFTQHEINLEKGDVIYTLTDGFPDQFGGEKGKKFMIKNLRDLLVKNSNLPMKDQKIILEKTFTSWAGDLEQVDDVTLVGIRI